MKFLNLLAAMLLCGGMAYAQQDDPVVMKINGMPILRSEFEYSYNKNNSDDVIDKKTVDEYVDLFINYKLKVAAAYDAKLDTLGSFKKEFATYRDQEVRPAFVDSTDIMAEAHAIYDRTIRDGQDMFQRDLEKVFNIRRSTVTGTLQLMEKRGLILRSPVEGDARLKGLQLTEAAVQIHDQIDQGIEHMEHKLRQGLSDEEVEQFHRMLTIISRNLSEPD